jgi:hypothetical protein
VYLIRTVTYAQFRRVTWAYHPLQRRRIRPCGGAGRDEHNSEIVGTNMAADVMGNPLNALNWLGNQLTSRGQALKPGDIVIT